MTTGADKNLNKEYPQCKCCGATTVTGEPICLWCQKDRRKVFLFMYAPSLCNYFDGGLRFCRKCLKMVAGVNDVQGWLMDEWDNGTYRTADTRDMEEDEFVATYYQDEFEICYENISHDSDCSVCLEWDEGYWPGEKFIKDTLCLADVQEIESIRTRKMLDDLEKQIAKENK